MCVDEILQLPRVLHTDTIGAKRIVNVNDYSYLRT